MRKFEVISQKSSKLDFWQNGHFLYLLAKKVPNFDISHGTTTHTLVDTWEKTLGSFQPKVITKIEVISQKP